MLNNVFKHARDIVLWLQSYTHIKKVVTFVNLFVSGEYDHWAVEYEEQQAVERSKKKKEVVNKQLEAKVQEKGGKITPSQATFQDPSDVSTCNLWPLTPVLLFTPFWICL